MRLKRLRKTSDAWHERWLETRGMCFDDGDDSDDGDPGAGESVGGTPADEAAAQQAMEDSITSGLEGAGIGTGGDTTSSPDPTLSYDPSKYTEESITNGLNAAGIGGDVTGGSGAVMENWLDGKWNPADVAPTPAGERYDSKRGSLADEQFYNSWMAQKEDAGKAGAAAGGVIGGLVGSLGGISGAVSGAAKGAEVGRGLGEKAFGTDEDMAARGNARGAENLAAYTEGRDLSDADFAGNEGGSDDVQPNAVASDSPKAGPSGVGGNSTGNGYGGYGYGASNGAGLFDFSSLGGLKFYPGTPPAPVTTSTYLAQPTDVVPAPAETPAAGGDATPVTNTMYQGEPVRALASGRFGSYF